MRNYQFSEIAAQFSIPEVRVAYLAAEISDEIKDFDRIFDAEAFIQPSKDRLEELRKKMGDLCCGWWELAFDPDKPLDSQNVEENLFILLSKLRADTEQDIVEVEMLRSSAMSVKVYAYEYLSLKQQYPSLHPLDDEEKKAFLERCKLWENPINKEIKSLLYPQLKAAITDVSLGFELEAVRDDFEKNVVINQVNNENSRSGGVLLILISILLILWYILYRSRF